MNGTWLIVRDSSRGVRLKSRYNKTQLVYEENIFISNGHLKVTRRGSIMIDVSSCKK